METIERFSNLTKCNRINFNAYSFCENKRIKASNFTIQL